MNIMALLVAIRYTQILPYTGLDIERQPLLHLLSPRRLIPLCRLVSRASVKLTWTPGRASTVSVVLFPERSQSLLLSVGIDICSNNKRHDVEERNPGLLWQEVLRKGERKRRGDPSDLHDGHEACFDSCADLMERASASDDCHGCQVDRVLDRCDLRTMSAIVLLNRPYEMLTTRLLTRI